MPNSNTPYLDQWFERVWNKKEDAAIDELMSPDVAIIDFGPTRMNGIDYQKYVVNKLRRKYSDIHINTIRGWGNKDAEIAECVVTASFNGEMIEAEFTAIIKIKNGKIMMTYNNGDAELEGETNKLVPHS